jgi:hypothetical protein
MAGSPTSPSGKVIVEQLIGLTKPVTWQQVFTPTQEVLAGEAR